MKKSTESVLERAAEAFALPAEALAGVPKLTLTGGGMVRVENHRGLLELGEDEISVRGRRVIMRILGDRLELRCMSAYELLITGTVTAIELVR